MEIENFDYDWKQNRSRIPEMTYNFKRIERYNHAKPPRFLVRFWTLFVSFLIGLVLMSVLFFNNLGMVKLGTLIPKHPYRIRIKILTKKNLHMD